MVGLAQCFQREQEFVEEPTAQVDTDRRRSVLEERQKPSAPLPVARMMPALPALESPDHIERSIDSSALSEDVPVVPDAFDDPGASPSISILQEDDPVVSAIDNADDPSGMAEPGPEPAREEALSPQTVAETLFGRAVMSYQVNDLFEQRFRGKTVQWSGVLTSVTQYPFDRVFGNSPGTKAVVEVQGTIKASVQLGSEALSDLRSKTGKPVAFEGKLLACEGFMNSIFVGEGRILWTGSD
jgi:hypothetical protein